MKLPNYVSGRSTEGRGTGAALHDPVLGTELARASTDGIDFAAALQYARGTGGPGPGWPGSRCRAAEQAQVAANGVRYPGNGIGNHSPANPMSH